MSKYLDKVGLEHYHDLIKDGLFEYIEGTQNSATSTWTGVSTSPSLSSGKLIIYHLPYAGGSTVPTLNLTLPDNTTTGAKTVGTRVGTSYSAGSNVILVYTGAAWDVVEADGSNLIANRAVVSDANGKLAESNVTSTELGYLSGVTSNVQTQISDIAEFKDGFSLYKWNRFEVEYEPFLLEGYSTFPSSQGTGNMRVSVNSGSADTYPRTVVRTAPSYTYDHDTGRFELSGATTDVEITSTSAASSIAGKYFKVLKVGYACGSNFNTTDVYHLASGATFSTAGSSTPSYIIASYSGDVGSVSKLVRTTRVKPETLTPIFDQNPTRYPNPSGMQDGYFYMYSGKVDESLDHATKVITGSYVGLGRRGSDAVHEIQCEYTPLFMIISQPGYYYEPYTLFRGNYTRPFALIDLSSLIQNPLKANEKPTTSGTQHNWKDYRCAGFVPVNTNGYCVAAIDAKYESGIISFYIGSSSSTIDTAIKDSFDASGSVYNYVIFAI